MTRLTLLILILAAQNAFATTTVTCVHDGNELSTALNAASEGGAQNAVDNHILLAAGAYSSAGPFTFNSHSGTALVLRGGYDAECAVQDLTPGASVLDGAGTHQVLSLQSTGDITVRRITIQNANYGASSGAAAAIYLNPANTPTLIFENNQVLNNVSTYATAGLVAFGTGTVYIRNNLFAGNTGPSSAAVSTSMASPSIIYFTNNTIAQNTNTSETAANPTMAIALGGGTAVGYVSNNISYGNSAKWDYYLYSFETFEFHNNDYHLISGAVAAGSAGNVDVDPLFFGSGNYRLQPTSPLIGIGLATPQGDLSATDLDGDPRTISGKVDLGAFEHDGIFADGFDGGE